MPPLLQQRGQAALPDLFQTLKSLDADRDRMTLATSRVTQDIIFVRPLILCESIIDKIVSAVYIVARFLHSRLSSFRLAL